MRCVAGSRRFCHVLVRLGFFPCLLSSRASSRRARDCCAKFQLHTERPENGRPTARVRLVHPNHLAFMPEVPSPWRSSKKTRVSGVLFQRERRVLDTIHGDWCGQHVHGELSCARNRHAFPELDFLHTNSDKLNSISSVVSRAGRPV